MSKIFKGDVQSADLENNSVAETEKINEWVRNKTNNKIQKLFEEPIEKNVTIVILNVLYFKGNS